MTSSSALADSASDRADRKMMSTLANCDPWSRFRAVVYGISRMSSWSCPPRSAPFGSSTPMTVNGMFLIRTCSPIGSWPGNSLRAIVLPITHTLVAPATSRSVKNSPAAIVKLRTIRKSGPTPCMHFGFQLTLPPITCAAGPDQRAGRPDGRALLRDGLGVLPGESLGPALAGSAGALLPGREDDQDVRPQVAELVLDQRLAPLADRHHDGHGRDADDHAQHGQQAAQLVLGELTERQQDEVSDSHGRCPPRGR